MKYLFFIISLSSLILCSEQNDQSIEIVTKDGNIFLGVIVDENGEQYILKTTNTNQISNKHTCIDIYIYIFLYKYK